MIEKLRLFLKTHKIIITHKKCIINKISVFIGIENTEQKFILFYFIKTFK